MSLFAQALAAGIAHHQAGRLQEAEAAYRLVLQAQPDHSQAWHLLGLVAYQLCDYAVAARCFGSALQLKPDYPEAHSDLGNVFFSQGRVNEAIESFLRALHQKPSCATTLFNLANAYRCQGNQQAAVEGYRQALHWKPDFAEAYCNLGNALIDLRRVEEGVDCYHRALELRPDLAEAHNSLGTVLYGQNRLASAAACYRRAIELRPNYAEAHSNLGAALRNLGELREAIDHHRRVIELSPSLATAHSGLLFTLHFSPDYDAAAIHDESLRWSQQHAEPLRKSIQAHSNDRLAGRQLRVGYVSPDFRNHCLAHFMMPLFSQHDHQQFEIHLYSNVVWPDEITERLRAHGDVWRDIAALSDEQVADQLRADRIDILVDLTMHMERSRLQVFAHKPAPVQVCWLAYPGTTGLPTMDYRLTDPYLDPPGLLDQYYSEESVRLPETFWCYDPLTDQPAVSFLPALNNGFVTFGCLNNFCKVNDAVLKLWARVLRSVEGSRLILLVPEGACSQNVLQLMHSEGILTDRITFVPMQPRSKYLELYNQIDIALDTFPYNGHTTSLDSFWMGVPVVTLVGKTVVGRAGLSQLNNLGLQELAADTESEFVATAVNVSGDLKRLARLRAELRPRMQASPLMDAPHFARNIEAAYRWMWRRWCAG